MSGRYARRRAATQMLEEGIKTLRPPQKGGRCKAELPPVGVGCNKAARYLTKSGERCFEHVNVLESFE